MARQIVWTAPAESDRKEILSYWIDRNGSAAYSLKLFRHFNTAINRTIAHPYIGRPTDINGIRVLRVLDHLIFYEVMADAIVVHHIWHERRDLSKLKF
jgi:toxin YoeB